MPAATVQATSSAQPAPKTDAGMLNPGQQEYCPVALFHGLFDTWVSLAWSRRTSRNSSVRSPPTTSKPVSQALLPAGLSQSLMSSKASGLLQNMVFRMFYKCFQWTGLRTGLPSLKL